MVAIARTLGILLLLDGCGRISFDATGGALSNDSGLGGDTTSASVCASTRLVAHWRLDETSGTTVVDSAGNNDGTWMDTNDGNLGNEVVSGRRAGALYFDNGTSVFVPGFVIPAEGTFSAWLTSDFDEGVAFSGSHPMVFDASPSPVRSTISFDSDMRVYGLRTQDVSWQASYAPPGDFVGWFHLTATWSATGARFFVDASPVGTPSVTDSRSTSLAGLYLGTRLGNDRQWGGNIDDVRFYDYAMTANEVAALYLCP